MRWSYRYSARSARIADFGFAPTMDLTTLPSTKTDMVGIDRIW